MVYCNSCILIGLQAMVYELNILYTISDHKYGYRSEYTLTRTAEEVKNCNFLGVFTKMVIILLTHVVYEIVLSTISYPTHARGIIDN